MTDKKNLAKKYITWLILIVIFLIRLPYLSDSISEVGISWRQSDTESIARNFVEEKFNIFYPQFNYDGAPPNYVELEFQVTTFLIAILYKIFGYHIILARLVPLTFFMISAFFMFLIGKKLFSIEQGWAIMAVYGTLPLTLFLSRAILPESALLCFFTGGFYFFLKWLDNQSLMTLLNSAVFTSLAISQKLPAVFIGLAMLGLCLVKFKRKTFIKWELWLFAAITLLPSYFYFAWLHTIAEFKFATRIGSLHIFPEFLTAITTPAAAKFYKTDFIMAFGWIVLITAILGLMGIIVRKDWAALFWSLSMMLEVILIVSVIRFRYYLALFTPIVALLSGMIIGSVWNKFKWGHMASLVLITIIFYNSSMIDKDYFKQEEWIKEAVKIINENTEKQDLIVISTFSPAILSQSDRKGWRANLKYYDYIPQDAKAELNYFIENGAKYFLVYKNRIQGDAGGYLKFVKNKFKGMPYGKDFVLYKLQ